MDGKVEYRQAKIDAIRIKATCGERSYEDVMYLCDLADQQSTALAAKDAEIERLQKLADVGEYFMDEVKDACCDGGMCVEFDIVEEMKRFHDSGLGNIQHVPYNPEVHGDCIEADKGELIWWWGPNPEALSQKGGE
jgi:hypothetical protein